MCAVIMPSTSENNSSSNAAASSSSSSSATPTATTSSSSSSAVPSSSASTTPVSASAVASSSSSSSATVNNGTNDVGSEDEVKVYNAEDETEDQNGEESVQDGLQEEKTSLISEQEKSAADLRHGFAGVHGFHSALSPFLAAYPGYAAYASVINQTNPTMTTVDAFSRKRSPFLYGDALSSPPPAHMGLRPPLYPLAHAAAAQYPYSMLNADIAAWHHSAQMYQASALRPGSPYGLPINSSNLSPMSRFSPGLLGHPGLAAAAAASLSPGAAGQPPHGHSLPHHIKQDYEGRHSGNSEKDSPKKNKETHIKKPLNAFMLYMKEMRPVVQAECTLKESAAINQILGRRWHSLSRDQQAKYYEKARVERQKHMQMYPHWNARDNYRFGLKKKKRKRDKTDDPASSMKKCRARYGLDQQDLWCKPCRRKKKCIRVQAYLDSKAGNGTSNANTNGEQKDSKEGIVNGRGSNGHGSIYSEEEADDEDDEHSPLTNGGGSLETGSEPSLTSPAGFSSIPSIGSPSGSVASPSTPSAHLLHTSSEAMAAAAAAATSTSASTTASSMDWLRAFKPTASYAAAAHAFAPPSHAGGLLGGLGGHSVGSDPRDSKHPLSVSRLTGSHIVGGGVPPVGGPTPLDSPLAGLHHAAAGVAAAADKRTLLGMT